MLRRIPTVVPYEDKIKVKANKIIIEGNIQIGLDYMLAPCVIVSVPSKYCLSIFVAAVETLQVFKRTKIEVKRISNDKKKCARDDRNF